MPRTLTLLFTICILLVGAASAQQPRTKPDDTAQDAARSADKGNLPGGSISGRVLNEDGTPAAGRHVSFYRVEHLDDPSPRQIKDAYTDKQGCFRVAGLIPGEFIVSTRLTSFDDGKDIDGNPIPEMAPYYKVEVTYYKETLDRKDALPVRVEAGAETSGIDIVLSRRPLREVSGVVIGRDGLPLARAEVRIVRRQKPDEPPYATAVITHAEEQGNWSLEVPDGLYLIEARNVITTFEDGRVVSGYQPPKPPTKEQRPAPANAQGSPLIGPPDRMKSVNWEPSQPKQVKVSGTDISGLLIDMNRRRQIISGRVTTEDGKPFPPEIGIDVILHGDYQRVSADGSFEFKGEELGKRYLDIMVQPYGTYYVKSIICDGVDYLREPFEFGNGVDYQGVEVVLAPGGAFLEVQVSPPPAPMAGNGSGVRVWLVPEEKKDWNAPQTWYCSRFGLEGKFAFYAAPGNYLVIFDEKGQNFNVLGSDDPEDFVKGRAGAAVHVHLGAGERKSVGILQH